jgi:ElaB/YqjD/DUF883 family membrane-anchored ribosome-binding protein
MARTTTDRAPEDIESDLEHTRRQIGRTIDAIQSRMTPGQMFQEFYDLARGGPTDYVRNLGLAAKNNPVPLALVAVGLTWLATSGGRTPSYLRGSHVPRGSAAEQENGGGGLAAATRGVVQSAADYAGALGRTVSGAASKIGEQAGSIVERAGETAAGTSEHVRQMADDARNLASEWSEGAHEAADTSRARMRDVSGRARQMREQMREKGGQLWHDQPLVVGAVGLAVGALLGALLPSTEQEDAAMGETRDKLVGQARALGESALHEATATATDMADAASQAAIERESDAEADAAVASDTSPKDAEK